MRAHCHWQQRLEEVDVLDSGVTHDLWQVVDLQAGACASIVARRRTCEAALKVFMKSTKRHGRPARGLKDRLRQLGAAPVHPGRGDEREMGSFLNRAGNFRLPFPRLERAKLRLQRLRPLQTFASVHALVPIRFLTGCRLQVRNASKQTHASGLDPRGLAFQLPDRKVRSGSQCPVRSRLTAPQLAFEKPCFLPCRAVRDNAKVVQDPTRHPPLS